MGDHPVSSTHWRGCLADGGFALSTLRVAGLTLLGALPAAAADLPLWEAGAGVGVLRLSDYNGADSARTYVLPIPYLVYRGKVLQIDRDKVRGLFLRGDAWEFDLSAAASVPVKSDRSPARVGMPDLDPTVEAGPRLSFTLGGGRKSDWQLDLRLPLRQVWSVHGGLDAAGVTFNPALNLDLRGHWPVPGWQLGLLAGPQFGDAEYHRYYYDVAPAYVRADRPGYKAGGGYGGLQATVALTRRFKDYWVGGFVRVNDVHGAVFEDSPLVRRKTDVSAGLGVSWVFARSATLVEAER